MSTPSLMIATPCFGGMVTHQYMIAVFQLMQRAERMGLQVWLELLGYESLITRGRATLLSRFLAKREATHLMFIDADIGFQPEQVFRMLALNEDVVAGMYPLKGIDWDQGALLRATQGEPIQTAPLSYVGTPHEGDLRQARDGFVSGLYAGTGFMMISRRAIDTLIAANPHLKFSGTHNGVPLDITGDEYALFECMIDPDTHTYLSEDYAFCRRWRDVGGAIWLDTVGELVHVGPHAFSGAPGRRYAAGIADTPTAV